MLCNNYNVIGLHVKQRPPGGHLRVFAQWLNKIKHGAQQGRSVLF